MGGGEPVTRDEQRLQLLRTQIYPVQSADRFQLLSSETAAASKQPEQPGHAAAAGIDQEVGFLEKCISHPQDKNSQAEIWEDSTRHRSLYPATPWDRPLLTSKISPAQPCTAPGWRSWQQVLGDVGLGSLTHPPTVYGGGGLSRCSLQEICGWELLPTTPLLKKPQCQARSLCAPQGH